MTDLSDFLLARIAEDEAAARAAEAHQLAPARAEVRGVWLNSRFHMTTRPARVLTECEAKRRIVANCQAILAVSGWEYDDAPDLATATLRALALPFADHPDYREEWKP